MGLFSFIKNAATEANNEAHGKRLLAGAHATFSELGSLNGQLQYVAMAGYAEIRDRLLADISNFTREGQIQLGRKMQDQAIGAHHVDRAGNYAKWLGGAWLESFGRLTQSSQSMEAFKLLNDFAEHIKREVLNELPASPPSPGDTTRTQRERDVACYLDLDILDFDDWLLAFKRIAARYNDGLSLDTDNQSLIDFMDLSPLLEAFNDGALPDDIAPAFAKQFNPLTFGRER